MGLLDFFSRGPLTPAKVEKIAKLAANPFAQPDVRMREMQRLLADGSPAALRGVLKRLASNASGHIADEDEKKWLEDQLVDVGEAALEPLAEFIGSQEQLTYALRAYRRIAGNEAAVAFFVEVLRRYGPDDYRSSEAKLQLVWQLADDVGDARVLPALVPFLLDHSDDVRWAIIDIVERAAKEGRLGDEARAETAARLGEIATGDEGRPRIQRRATEMLAELEWTIPGDGETLSSLLAEDFFIDKKRYIRRRARKK